MQHSRTPFPGLLSTHPCWITYFPVPQSNPTPPALTRRGVSAAPNCSDGRGDADTFESEVAGGGCVGGGMLLGGETRAPELVSEGWEGGWGWAGGGWGKEGGWDEEGCWDSWLSGGIWERGVELNGRRGGLGERRKASKSSSAPSPTPTPRPKSETLAGGRKSSIEGLDACPLLWVCWDWVGKDAGKESVELVSSRTQPPF